MMRAISLCFLFAGLAVAPSFAESSHFDHSAWDRLLSNYVDSEGRVAYRDIQQTDRERFDAYIEALATAEPDAWPERQQLAFWINAYNAGIFLAVFQGFSAESLLGRAKLFKFWKFEVAGKRRTLDEIEHKILRKRFTEPRIHFALVCASTSCPRLPQRAFVAARLDAQLDEAARLFINDPERNRFDVERGKAKLSKIFDWFKKDFERDGTLVQFLARYVDDESARDWLRAGGDIDIDHLDYDWSLNVQPEQRPLRPKRGALERS
jgi:hypothetical protein